MIIMNSIINNNHNKIITIMIVMIIMIIIITTMIIIRPVQPGLAGGEVHHVVHELSRVRRRGPGHHAPNFQGIQVLVLEDDVRHRGLRVRDLVRLRRGLLGKRRRGEDEEVRVAVQGCVHGHGDVVDTHGDRPEESPVFAVAEDTRTVC